MPKPRVTSGCQTGSAGLDATGKWKESGCEATAGWPLGQDPGLTPRPALRVGGTHLLLEEARGAAADGQQRRVAQRLAHREAAQQSIALRERQASVSVARAPGCGGRGAGDAPTCRT